MGSIQLGSDITRETSPLSTLTEGSGRCSIGVSLPKSSCEADRPKTWCEKCTPMCASARVAPSNIVYLWYRYRSTGIDVLTTENCFSNVIWIYVMYKKDTSV